MVNKAEARAKQLTDRDDNDIRWLMSTSQGRRIMSRIMTVSGFERLSMTGNSYTYFNEGQRAVGKHFYELMLDLCPEAFLEMLKEAKRELKETEELTKDDNAT